MQACAYDVVCGEVDVRRVRCVVLDEVHCARGNHAYYQLVQSINARNTKYRLMGLLAALPNNADALQALIRMLNVEAIEYRTESSPDVKCYVPTFTRNLHSCKMLLEKVR